MGKIPFLKLADMENIKSNAVSYLPHFSNDSNDWIAKTLGHNVFGETKYEMPEIKLYMPQEIDGRALGERDKGITDKKNVREVYSKLKFLSDSQASEERLWAGLCLGPMWQYVSYRWKIDSVNSIKQHYFFGYGPRRSLTRNAVSRLWWIGRLTYDAKREDPFELTDFVCENSRFIVDVLERNVSDSLPLMKEFLSACVDAKKQGLELNTNNIRELEKYMDILGGIFILDYMPEGFLYNKILEKAKELLKEESVNARNGEIDQQPLQETMTAEKNTISEASTITIEYETGKKAMFNLKKQKLHTKPKSIIGLTEGVYFNLGGKRVKILKIN